MKATDREALKRKLSQGRHEAIDAYLDGAESFAYVEFARVFDCRPLGKQSDDFLQRVGLALRLTPKVGLLRPIVVDTQWEVRLRLYVQLAALLAKQDFLGAAAVQTQMEEQARASGHAGASATATGQGNSNDKGDGHRPGQRPQATATGQGKGVPKGKGGAKGKATGKDRGKARERLAYPPRPPTWPL